MNQKIRSFSDFLDGIVVVDLGAVGQDDRTKNMLVVVFLNLFYEHMLKIEEAVPWEQSPAALRGYHFARGRGRQHHAIRVRRFEARALARAGIWRRGGGACLAIPFALQDRSRKLWRAVADLVVQQVRNITVRELESVGLTRVDTGIVDRIKTLACHECLYKTFDVGGEFMRATPFYELFQLPPP